ncbi:Zinc metalloproteinase nas-7 [Sarcoptes scabiei]|uniref:Metalloendopeptidase n=1 Tax=Sarcoptes scabiei TaxID=52283 RepID=A0A834R373_SARSC|nr:Zinc metalloproteinase nas-7 [Sarcoptes scabiei]
MFRNSFKRIRIAIISLMIIASMCLILSKIDDLLQKISARLYFDLNTNHFHQTHHKPVRFRRTNFGIKRKQILINRIGIDNFSRLWPKGIVHYIISPSLSRYRSTIEDAMREIESETCIRFKQLKNLRRRSIQQIDHIFLVYGDGCHSIVGRAGYGRQILSLGEGCHDIGSIIHELCHSIGLFHEHTRFDRDRYLTIVWNNIAPEMFDQFEKIPISEYHPVQRFDFNSIMIYGRKAFSKNGLDTIVPKDRRALIEESHFKDSLSRSDIININALYNCPNKMI